MMKRELYMGKIRSFMDKPLIKVLTGIRRSGKSMLLQLIQKELKERGIPDKRILYINFESLQHAYITDYMVLYQIVKERADSVSGKLYILLDELQDVDGWEKAANSFLVDFDCDVYVTGSNATLLASEYATHIAGRYVEIRVYPLTFSEYLEFSAQNRDEIDLSVEQHFMNYLRFGGMPGIHMAQWDELYINQYLTDIFNSVILKDVIKRNGIRESAQLERVVLFLFDNVGNIFSAKTITDYVKNQGRSISNETVYSFLRALEGAYIIHKVPRFDIKGKRILETQEKYYIADLGIRHAVIGYRDNDIAGLLENVVFMELLSRGYTVNIGKQDATEVDFVAQLRDERLYLQVCYLLTDNAIEREFAPLEAIRDNFEKLILSMDTTPSFNRNGIKRGAITDFLLKK